MHADAFAVTASACYTSLVACPTRAPEFTTPLDVLGLYFPSDVLDGFAIGIIAGGLFHNLSLKSPFLRIWLRIVVDATRGYR